MISFLKGAIASLSAHKATVQTDSGIGFEVHLIKTDSLKEKQQTELFIYTHWNQEQGPSLFGFFTQEERSIFELIISCSGIGPKMGISILSQIEPAILINAIKNENTKTLSSINGIGPKKAEQIIFQLKNKISDIKNLDVLNSALSNQFDEVAEVLNSLNYSKSEVYAAFNYLNKNFEKQNLNFDELLRKSLSFLSKTK
jgi:holliday junction DNA helicase RuvA